MVAATYTGGVKADWSVGDGVMLKPLEFGWSSALDAGWCFELGGHVSCLSVGVSSRHPEL